MESLLLTLLTALFAVLCLYKARREKPFAASPLPPDVTTALKGIFALTVIFHHLAQRTWAGWVFQNFRGVGYLCVAGFFFISGYGLQKQVLSRPDYLCGFFRRRVLPILQPFGIVSVVCWVLSAVAKGRIWVPWDMLTALPWGDTVVPFSWYVLSLLVFYPVLALCIKLCRRPQHLPAYIAVYTALYIAFCAAFGFGAFWYNTIPLLPLGMLFAVQEEKVLTFARKRYWLLALPIWLAFLALYPVTDRLMGTQYGSPLCIVLNWLSSALFAAGLILMLMKVRIGNPVLDYLGKHSLELYLCQGIFMELLLRSNLLHIYRDILYDLASLALTLLSAHILRFLTRFLTGQIDPAKTNNQRRITMGHYQNFKTVIYCTSQSMVSISAEALQRQIDFFQKYVGVDKVYLEPYRDDCLIPHDQLKMCKEIFHKNGIEIAGGITTTISGETEEDQGRQRLFNTYCYSNDRMRNHLKETVEFIAAEYDEFIIDDFFFTNCTCDDCRRLKGDKSWEEFRLEQMREVSENLIIKPAKAVNPNIRITIKFPNWIESYQEAGYNPAQQRDMYEMVYTGTETRHQKHTDQHLPRYESYSIMRWMENFAPGKNGGGWFDCYQCYPMDSYLEQAYLTVLSRPREVMMFCWGSLYKNKLITPMGMQLEQLDKFLSKAGNPVGLPCYLPCNAQGEDHVEDYLGMAGIPFEGVAEFPADAKSLFLTVQAVKDPDILAKLEKYVAAGGKAIVTSGFMKEMLGKGIEQMTSIRYRDRIFTATEFMSEPTVGWGNNLSHSLKPVTFPVMEHRNNTTWCLAKGFGEDESYGILLRDTYGKGKLLTLVVPDAISDIKNIPQTVLTKIRYELSVGDVYLDAPSQISLFTYDNDVFCLYAYACDNCAAQRIQLRVKGIATDLYNVKNEKFTIKPLYTTNNETVFELFSEPGDLAFYGIHWAENREGVAFKPMIGSAPHDFED